MGFFRRLKITPFRFKKDRLLVFEKDDSGVVFDWEQSMIYQKWVNGEITIEEYRNSLPENLVSFVKVEPIDSLEDIIEFCPFCGGKLWFFESYIFGEHHTVGCSSCKREWKGDTFYQACIQMATQILNPVFKESLDRVRQKEQTTHVV